MRSLIHIILLAAADYRRERLLSLCSVLGLTAVLAPLLILYGVKFGVMTTLSERMLSDPNTTEITPVSSGRYTKADMDAFRTLPGVAFVLPRTRSIAATMNLALTRDGKTARTTVSLEPTAAGDPVLVRYKMDNVTMVARPQDSAGAAAPSAPKTPAFALAKVPDVASPALREAGCILSDTAAGRLQAEKGDLLLGTVERAKNGLISRAYVRLRVIGILPVAAQQKPMSYVPLELLEAVEDFRDHRAVPELGAENGWTGEARPTEARQYAGFRLYADSLGRVTFLRSHFAARGIETYTHAEEIEQIQMLETGLTLIFTLICSTAAVGFFLSTSSSVFAGIKRKERTLGLLQLTGFSTGSLMFFPLTQAFLTAFVGSLAAIGAYAAFSTILNTLFAEALQSGEVCRLLPVHFLMAAGLAIGISLLAALGPALHSTRIEPSEVIRDV